MRSTSSILLFVLAISMFTGCDREAGSLAYSWQKITSPFTGQLHDIQFLNNDTGYILGLNTEIGNYYNALLETTDRGKTWRQQTFPVPEPGGVGLMFVYNSNLIFAAKDGIFKTTDRGVLWSVLDSDFNATWNRTLGIHFFNPDEGLAVKGGAIYKTTDGGTHFTISLNDNSGYSLKSLQVVSNTAYVEAGSGHIFKSADRGKTWNTIPVNFHMGLSFVTDMIGYGLSLQDIYKTTDGGITWRKVSREAVGKNDMSKLFFLTEDEGFIITASGEIYHTNNAGENWALEHSEEGSQLNDIAADLDKNIFVVGENGLILVRSR